MRLNRDAVADQRHGPSADSLEDVADIETALLLEGVYRRFGQDYRGHARDPIRHRLQQLMVELGLPTLSALLDSVLHRPGVSTALFRALSGRPPGLFEAPAFHRALRRHLALLLRSRPLARIWIAGSPSLAEVWSLCLLLAEEKLLERTQLFITAPNDELLAAMRDGSLEIDDIGRYQERYRQAGGVSVLNRSCHADGTQLALLPEWKRRCTWAVYHLTSDASFNEFDLILCRGALDEFGVDLRRRVLRLFDDSLGPYGLLGIDPVAEIETAPFKSCYRALRSERDLYQRLG